MRFSFFVCVLLFCSPSFSQGIVPLEEGAPAPFDGVLLDKETAADIIASGELNEERCKIKLEYEIGKATNSCMLDKGIAEANLRAEKERNEKIIALKVQEIDRLNKQLEKTKNIDWGPAWFAGGAMIGISTSLVIFFIAVQTVNVDVTKL